MKTAVHVAFALLLLSLPASDVLAQAVPDEFAPTEVPQLVEEASTTEPEASAWAPHTALLWQPVFESRAMASGPAVVAPPPRAWSDWSTRKKTLVIGGGVLALIILGIVSIG